MAERLTELTEPASAGKPDGLYQIGAPKGHHFYVLGGVMHLPMHPISAAAVLSKRKKLLVLTCGDGNPMVFMRAADVIEAWPHVERQVRNLAAKFGLAI